MRKIAFRAWAVASREMFAPDEDNGWELLEGKLNPLPNTILMQSTVLRDSNDVEIFEGDIIEGRMTFGGGFLPTMGEVVYDETFAAFALKNEGGLTLFHNHILSSFKIIGNVYEDKELLE